ncbi:ABC1-domain-containing protein [Rhizodiscina lignyota]|uniref:ABC1-domain-containing protein n=1 Tax=Rhizodiscina lignyota TaxID=1504668 RepID=A0A9P4IRC8_9PEZI|nr:ABC1-domain-containing protein [Rhizodiscina lignyota]
MQNGCRFCRTAPTALRSFSVASKVGPQLLTRHPIASRPSVVRSIQTQQFSPLTPPNPADLPKPRLRKRRRWPRRLVYLSLFLAAGYYADTTWNSSALTRSLRTFRTGLIIGLDYKINFRAHPPLAHSIEEVHARNATRIFNLLRENGGLYLKIGQAIAMQSAILPPQFQKMFARMFDDAPQNEWKDVEKVVREDFGMSVEEAFGVSFSGEEGKGLMERTARASASVAQVHWARLGDGREVAIKIQKKEIATQVGWDLWSFKVVAAVYSWWFDLPVKVLVPYISERLMLETDFINEANNSEEMAKFVAAEPRLRGRVYIPKVYRNLSSRRVMTAEWIEGIRLWDKEGIEKPWEGGWHNGSPGAGGAPLPEVTAKEKIDHIPSNDPNNEKLKPERTAWRGPNRTGGLGLSYKPIMTTMVDLFSAQMFLWGLVHCDPHPGNIFIRRLPSGNPELVLIDHGLYIRMSPEFKHQYSRFWKALISFDNATIKDVVNSWGVTNPDVFASATLMRPYSGGDMSTNNALRKQKQWEEEGLDEQERAYRMQQEMRKGIRQILGDENKWPRELIFIGRNLRIVQGNNQFLGSPVNRIKITGLWASRALVEDKDLSLTQRAGYFGRHLVFRLVLWASDVAWWYYRARQVLGIGGGMDQEIEENMKRMAKGMGIELNHGVFEG